MQKGSKFDIVLFFILFGSSMLFYESDKIVSLLLFIAAVWQIYLILVFRNATKKAKNIKIYLPRWLSFSRYI